jgi:hypothetical protein
LDAVVEQVVALLPQGRRTTTGHATHRKNVGAMIEAVVPS